MMRPYLLRICSPALASWPVLVVVVLASATLSITAAGTSASGPEPIRWGLAAAAGAACFGIVAASWLALLQRLTGTVLIAVTLAVLLVAGVVRGTLLQFLLADFGLTSMAPSYAALRVISSAITMPVVMGLTAGMVATLREYRRTASALVTEQARLAALVDESARSIEQRQRAVFERVQGELQAQVRELDVQSTPQAVAALEGLVGNVVRPLSHTLARDVSASDLPEVRPTRVSWASVLTAPDVRFAFRPTAFVAILVVLALPASLLSFHPARGLFIVAVSATALWLTLALGRRIVERWSPSSAAGIWSVIVGWYLVGAIVTFVSARLAEQDAPARGVLSLSGCIAVAVLGPFFAIILMVGERMRESTAELDATTRRLAWHLARVNTERWEQNGRLSRALHGPVQSLLYAAMLRLRHSVNQGTVDPAFIDELSRELSQALLQSMSPLAASEHVDAAGVLQDIALTWRGVAEVTQRISPDTVAALQGDPVCARLLVDLAGEAVSNAVRHGGATHIDITVTQTSEDVMELLVADDGTVSGSPALGLGTHVLRSCTIEYQLAQQPTRLIARLPYEALGLLPA